MSGIFRRGFYRSCESGGGGGRGGVGFFRIAAKSTALLVGYWRFLSCFSSAVRCRLSASPATGLLGMQENGFLNEYFGCLGLLPLATER